MGSGDVVASCVEIIKLLIHKAGFSREVAKVIPLDLRGSTAAFYWRKWSRFLHYTNVVGVILSARPLFHR